jgi:hypothetical protein
MTSQGLIWRSLKPALICLRDGKMGETTARCEERHLPLVNCRAANKVPGVSVSSTSWCFMPFPPLTRPRSLITQ